MLWENNSTITVMLSWKRWARESGGMEGRAGAGPGFGQGLTTATALRQKAGPALCPLPVLCGGPCVEYNMPRYILWEFKVTNTRVRDSRTGGWHWRWGRQLLASGDSGSVGGPWGCRPSAEGDQ